MSMLHFGAFDLPQPRMPARQRDLQSGRHGFAD
jgi:hypothetical protein